MEPFTSVQGRAIPLLLPDIDTDVITPIERVMQGGDALTRYAFESLRYGSDGAPDPACPLNQEAYRAAPILLAGANFACGSSRETAVWAIRGLGIRCVIAPSFGEIFFDSCIENGLLPIALPVDELDALVAEAGTGELRVDLQKCEITAPSGRVTPFAVHPLQREALLSGRDSIELTLSREAEIEAFQLRDRDLRPWVYELDPRG
jgi:3-isopropylmalate/(R)-2-methylmalate dehydratase small subunit